jgi:hypothetical protein
MPWSALGFVMIALGVLMSGTFTRRGVGRLVFVAVILAGVYQSVLLTILNAAAKNEALMPVIYILTALPIVAGMAILMMPGLLHRRVPVAGPTTGPTTGPTAGPPLGGGGAS